MSKPALWSFERIRPVLLRAGDLTPVEKAERRVLVLNDPGRGEGAMQVTASIYVGLQQLLPGEMAPAHRHTPGAARRGVYHCRRGRSLHNRQRRKIAMKRGDLVLTPGGMWHDHRHDGKEPVIWLDALDLPLILFLEVSYAEEADFQAPRNRADASAVEYRHTGIVPARGPSQAAPPYPLLRYPWEKTEQTLRTLYHQRGASDPVEVDFVNPETGGPCLPTMGFTAMMLPSGQEVSPPLRSCSAAFHVVAGRGRLTAAGEDRLLRGTQAEMTSWRRGLHVRGKSAHLQIR